MTCSIVKSVRRVAIDDDIYLNNFFMIGFERYDGGFSSTFGGISPEKVSHYPFLRFFSFVSTMYSMIKMFNHVARTIGIW